MTCLNFYNEYKNISIKPYHSPMGFISLQKLKVECNEHLSVLNVLETISRGVSPFSEAWVEAVLKELETNYPKYLTLCTDSGTSYRALVSRHYSRVAHFVLAYTFVNKKSDELINWFIKNENRLFGLQFICLPAVKQREIMLNNNLVPDPIERNYRLEQEPNIQIEEVYKVPWVCVLPLVTSRRVPLRGGKAYIGVDHLHQVAGSHHRLVLKKFLSRVRISLPNAKLDGRFDELIVQLGERCQRIVSRPYWCEGIDEDEAVLKSLPALSLSFPPCMSRMHQHMESTKHLKYHGRTQLTSFLMDIGLSVDDTLTHFQNTFMQGMTEIEYSRGRYEYSIKYLFGLVGRQTREGCSDCLTLQRRTGGAGEECHGCPLTTPAAVKRLLSLPNYRDIGHKDKRDLISMISDSQSPSTVCAAILAAKHNVSSTKLPLTISSPLQYYALSRKLQDNDSDVSD